MRRLLVVTSFLLIAATPAEVLPELEETGYYIEPGSAATEEVVSDAVFQARAEGGRLHIVVLVEEPPGGATTFSDSVLDQLGTGYVVTVAPETVGFAGDGSFWSADEMNAAVDASLQGGSDDEVVELFVAELTGGPAPAPVDGEGGEGAGLPGWLWLVLLVGGGLLVLNLMTKTSRQRTVLASEELAKVKGMAREKLAAIANDIIEMEDEVMLSDNPEIREHYQKASVIYTEALSRVEAEPGAADMVGVVKNLDDAIWELDAAEALLDGKPIPERPKPPEPRPPQPRQPTPVPTEERTEEDFGRRPQRQSSYAGNELMSALWALLTMTGRGGGSGMPGGFGGPMRGGGGAGRMRGGGFRGMGGRMRGGGRRG